MTGSRKLGRASRKCLLVWGNVNFIPHSITENSDLLGNKAFSLFIKDQNHFLAAVSGYDMVEWFRRIVHNNRPDLKGLLTIFQPQERKIPLIWEMSSVASFIMIPGFPWTSFEFDSFPELAS